MSHRRYTSRKINFSEYFLEDAIQLVNFSPPPIDRKKKKGGGGEGEEEEEEVR